MAGKHRFAVKHTPDLHTISRHGQLQAALRIGIPAFKQMRMAGFVQADIGFLHFAGNPGAGLPFARRGGARRQSQHRKMAVGTHNIRFVAQGFWPASGRCATCADRAPCAVTAPTSKSVGRLNTTGKCLAHKRPTSARCTNRRPPPPARHAGRWLCAHRESAGFSGLTREYPQQPTFLRPCRTIGLAYASDGLCSSSQAV